MDLEQCAQKIQKLLANNPVVILGSGASIQYGLPSMDTLAREICKNEEVKKDKQFKKFSSHVSDGLEKAIDESNLSLKTLSVIQRIVWDIVNQPDLAYLYSNYEDFSFGLSKLFQKIINTSLNKVNVVTTNYDRIAEYAADAINANIVTGFEGEYLKKFEALSSSTRRKQVRNRERVVDIWKVHGSLDWFKCENGEIYSIPLSGSIPEQSMPLIIPPSSNKYSVTHEEPYRTIIANADMSFSNADSFICIGYGFNDSHIQPKLITQLEKGKPIVILTKEATSACHQFIIENQKISNYLVFEEGSNMQTRVFHGNEISILEGNFWHLDAFLTIW